MRDILAAAIADRGRETTGQGRGVVVDTTAGAGPVDVVIAGSIVPAHLDTDLTVYAGETVNVTPSASGVLSVTAVVSWRPTAGVAADTVEDTVQVRCAHPDLGGCTVTCRMAGTITAGSPVAMIWTAAGPVAIPVNSAEPVPDPIAWDDAPEVPNTLTVPEPDVPAPSEVAVRPSWWTGESNVGNTVTSGLRIAPQQTVIVKYEMPPIDWGGRVTLTLQRTREGAAPSPIVIKLADTGGDDRAIVRDMAAKTPPVAPGETIVFDMPPNMAGQLLDGAANSLVLSADQPIFIESPAVNISSALITVIKEN